MNDIMHVPIREEGEGTSRGRDAFRPVNDCDIFHSGRKIY